MFDLIKLFTVCFVLTSSLCGQANVENSVKENNPKDKSDIHITYIANEGVLIKVAGKRVLIDGLHRKYRDAYAFPPDDLRAELEGAKGVYGKIDLLLVSHLHGDHFHPQSVGLHLKNNPKSVLASSPQIIEGIKKDFGEFEKIKAQAKEIPHEWKKSSEKDFDGIKVKFLGLRHGSERFKWIENLGHLIEIGGKKFLHIGDADMTAENFSVYQLDKENIDVAILPYWFLLSEKGRNLVKTQFNPKKIVAVHISPNDAGEVSETLKKYYSDITVFTKILELVIVNFQSTQSTFSQLSQLSVNYFL
jgi:L-ascorbate metabolism protein UlaG (beta-lactamase superfamily)